MKKLIKTFGLPIAFGVTLTIITLIGLLSTTFVGCEPLTVCPSDQCEGTNGHCYSCDEGSYCTTTPSGNCSSSVYGVYCCTGTGGGGGGGGGGTTTYCNSGNTYNYSSQMCCPNSTPYYYPGTHGITGAGCYASCPYVNDCGTRFQRY